MRRLLLVLVLLGAAACAPPGGTARAQSRPPVAEADAGRGAPGVVWGMVWTPPEDVRAAARDLRAMRRAGVRAVRTPPVTPPVLLTLADSLGLALYQDVAPPVLSAAQLRDTLAAVERMLRAVLARAEGHPSARHVGLAVHADTGDPAACDAVNRLAAVARRAGGPDVRTYLVTALRTPAAHRCGRVADLVLLDVRDRADPLGRLRAWQAASDAPVGLAAVGTWTRAAPEAGGRRRPHTPAAQARTLERRLHALAGAPALPPVAFVARWRDAPDAGRHRYGLHDRAGRPRPAARVAAGFMTGRQRVFALPPGKAPPPGAPPLVLVSWGVAALLGVAYARLPRLRLAASRYAWAHAFYRDALREGRELLPMVSGGLGAVAALSLGAVAWLAVRLARDVAAAALAVRALPAAWTDAAHALLAVPTAAGGAVGGAWLLATALWMAALGLAAPKRRRLRPGQLLMLVTWPHWTALAVLAAAAVLASAPGALARDALPWLAGGVALALVVATARVVVDYAALTRLPAPVVAALALASPPALAALALALAAALHGDALAFAWRLLTQT